MGSSPAANATVSAVPAAVQIWFGERLEAGLSSVEVYDAQRQSVQTHASEVDGGNPREIVAPLRPGLPNGTYTVVWHVVSADDGHTTAGVFAFGIGEPARAPVIAAQHVGADPGQKATLVGVLGRWLTYLGTVLVLGTAFLMLFVAGGAVGAPAAPAGRASRPDVAVVLAAALLSLLVGQALALLDEQALISATAPPPPISQLLFGTRFGALWLGRTALLLAAATLVVWEMRSPAGDGRPEARRLASSGATRDGRFWIAMLVVGVGLISDLAWSGHAAAGSLLAYAGLIQATISWGTRTSLYLPAAAALATSAKTLTLVVDWLHLAAVSVWIGGLLALAAAAWTAGPSAHPPWLGPAVGRFSRIATVGIVVVLLTGLYNTWLYLSGPAAYLATDYGQSLLLKHAAIVALLLAVAVNRFATVPLLAEGKTPARVPRWVVRALVARPQLGLRVEAALALVVLLSTGWLTSLAYARTPEQVLLDPARELALAAEPFQTTLALGGRRSAAITLAPGRVGPNTYAIEVDQAGVPARDVARAYLELAPRDVPGSASSVVQLGPSGPGRFTGQGLDLSASGPWRVTVRVYRTDGGIETAATSLQVTDRWAASVDPGARALLAEAEQAMAGLRSARMVESLGDGAGGLSLADYAFIAPDRAAIVNPVGTSVIQIGTTTYVRDRGAAAWRAESGATAGRPAPIASSPRASAGSSSGRRTSSASRAPWSLSTPRASPASTKSGSATRTT